MKVKWGIIGFHATKIFTTIEGGAVITRTAANENVDKLGTSD